MPGSVNFKGTPGLAAMRVQHQAQREAALQAAAERLSEAEREALRAQLITPPVRRTRGKGGPIGPASDVLVGERGPETFIPAMPGTIETPQKEES